MKKKHLLLYNILFLLMATEVVLAQPSLPSVHSQAPIDSGLSLPEATGGVYAIKKL